MKDLVYWNGEFIPYEEVKVPLEDRGYLFADGVYEVIRVYKGKLFAFEEHFDRLKNSAEALEIPLPLSAAELASVSERLIESNRPKGNSTVYIQLTRGAAPRNHLFPERVKPNLWMMLKPFDKRVDHRTGVRVITLQDERWSRCDIKSISLLPNVLAREKARRADAFEAVMFRDGLITEATSSSFFMVDRGIIKTPPLTHYILPGVTRKIVLKLCSESHFPYEEVQIPRDEIYHAQEVFLTGTSMEVLPVIEIDGIKIGDAAPGRIAKELLRIFCEYAGVCSSD